MPCHTYITYYIYIDIIATYINITCHIMPYIHAIMPLLCHAIYYTYTYYYYIITLLPYYMLLEMCLHILYIILLLLAFHICHTYCSSIYRQARGTGVWKGRGVIDPYRRAQPLAHYAVIRYAGDFIPVCWALKRTADEAAASPSSAHEPSHRFSLPPV